jgi:ABC-type nitrate/sulfonate/bicarbonate transport system ATPase subunit
MFELRDLCASWPGRGRVLEGISVIVPAGRTESIIGPSGSGKTTLLLAAAGLKPLDSGEVLLEGSGITAGDTRIGLVLQQYGLFPWFTAAENAALGLRVRGVRRGAREAAACSLMKRVGLADRARSFPAELSGGEQQRVAIARGISLEPRLLLMDEPFSALDAMTRESLQDLLLRLLRERPLSAVVVTHSIEEAAFLGDSISLLAGRPARIVERFDNPGRGSRGFRSSSDFFKLESSIREALARYRTLPDEH